MQATRATLASWTLRPRGGYSALVRAGVHTHCIRQHVLLGVVGAVRTVSGASGGSTISGSGGAANNLAPSAPSSPPVGPLEAAAAPATTVSGTSGQAHQKQGAGGPQDEDMGVGDGKAGQPSEVGLSASRSF
jgi:hypothetical protein